MKRVDKCPHFLVGLGALECMAQPSRVEHLPSSYFCHACMKPASGGGGSSVAAHWLCAVLHCGQRRRGSESVHSLLHSWLGKAGGGKLGAVDWQEG